MESPSEFVFKMVRAEGQVSGLGSTDILCMENQLFPPIRQIIQHNL
jgi:hypothetical protein